jgi:ketosteroid isomerase-like protein
MGESADIVRLAFERFNSGDDDGFLELCAPQVYWHDPPEIPDSQEYNGRDGVRQWLKNVREPMEGLQFGRWDIEESGRCVLVNTSAEGEGMSSGAAVGWRFWTVWRVHEGLITYHHGWSDEAQAREDFEQG